MADAGRSGSSDRHALLLRAKLRGVLAARGLTPTLITAHGVCAAVAAGDAWVLDAGDGRAVLGPAVAFGLTNGCAAVHVVTDDATTASVLARRGACFAVPVSVWRAVGADLVAVEALGQIAERDASPDHVALIDDIVAGGADPVVEHGVVAGEVAGLEVCRVVDDPVTGAVRLEVGVGAHDREAFAMLHGDRPTIEALAEIADIVRRHRAPCAEPHPLNRLARERSLRHRLIGEPRLIGATHVWSASPPVGRTNVGDPVPCCALATIDERLVTVVCSTGIDLDVVPFAADARAFHHTEGALIVVPERDALAVQRRISGALGIPIEIIGLPEPQLRRSP